MQKIHGIDLLRMDVEFLRDDFREIFFFAADNIVVREHELYKGPVVSRERQIKNLLLQKTGQTFDEEELEDLAPPVEVKNEKPVTRKEDQLKGLGDDKIERGVRTYMSDLFDKGS